MRRRMIKETAATTTTNVAVAAAKTCNMSDPPSPVLSRLSSTSLMDRVTQQRPISWGKWLTAVAILVTSTTLLFLFLSKSYSTSKSASSLTNDMMSLPPHVVLPPRSTQQQPEQQLQQLSTQPQLSNLTLRDYLLDPEGFYLAMAPSFFGFYGYFGALAGIEEGLFGTTTRMTTSMNETQKDGTSTDLSSLPTTISSTPELLSSSSSSLLIQHDLIRGVAGASAGAMAAIVLAAGISPSVAAEFCSRIRLQDFIDFPAWFGIWKGDRFEAIMDEFLQMSSPIFSAQKQNDCTTASTRSTFTRSLQLQDALIPVGVSAFDVQTFQSQILTHGSMARAARASACFPILFQPVGWIDASTSQNYVFVDGGIQDTSGLEGLAAIQPNNDKHHQAIPTRIVNMVVGDFHLQSVPGPSSMPQGLTASTVLSISIQNLPRCGPWAMDNGPRAVQAAKRVLQESLDLPLILGKEPNHFELHLDASHFVNP